MACYLDWFLDIEPGLPSRDKFHIVMMCSFYVLLDLGTNVVNCELKVVFTFYNDVKIV